MPRKTNEPKKTYFGLAALMAAAISGTFLIAYFTVSQLNIPAATFSLLNNWTAFGYCLTTPIAFVLAILGSRGVHGSKQLALIALGITVVPFLIIMTQFAWSFIR